MAPRSIVLQQLPSMNTSPSAPTERLLSHPAETYPDEVEECRASTDTDLLLGDPHMQRKLEKRLLRKLDLRVAFLALLHSINYIDRGNIASARLKGLEEDLHMAGQQFNALISCFYVGYVLMQVPSNIFLNQLNRPSVYISCCVFLWGIISIIIGVSQSFRAALISRFLLGFSQAVFYPGAIFVLSTWYKCDELGLRIAYITCGSTLGTSFGSLIESGIFVTMDGKFGYAAWRWLFFIEGGLTCVIALFALYLVPDFPAIRASWLTAEEQLLAQKRMAENLRGITDDSLKGTQVSGLMESFTDLTVWWLATALLLLEISQSFMMFFPTIVATMGYSPSVTLLLCVPPQILNVIASFFVTSHSDITKERFWHTTGCISMGVIGFTIAASTMNDALRYTSLFFMQSSIVSYIVLATWANNSIPEPSKRAVVIAFLNVFASIGDTVMPYLWPSSWGPSYSNSFLACTLLSLMTVGILWVLRTRLLRFNRQAKINELALGFPTGFRYIT